MNGQDEERDIGYRRHDRVCDERIPSYEGERLYRHLHLALDPCATFIADPPSCDEVGVDRTDSQIACLDEQQQNQVHPRSR